MGSRDRPSKEKKKKAKSKTVQPSLAPLSEPPRQVELIRRERKPRRVDEEPEEG